MVLDVNHDSRFAGKAGVRFAQSEAGLAQAGRGR